MDEDDIRRTEGTGSVEREDKMAQQKETMSWGRRVRLLVADILDDRGLTEGAHRWVALGLALLGLAFWWPLLRNSVTGFVFAAAASGASAFGSREALCLFAVTVLMGAVGGALGIRQLRRLPVWAIPLAGLLASVANTSALLFPGTVSLVMSAVLLALVLGGFSVGWGTWLVRWATGGREILLVAAASYAVSFGVGYLSYLPDPLALVRPLGAPLISGACWYGCWHLGAQTQPDAQAHAVGPAAKTSPTALGLERNLYLLVLVFFLVGSVATGFINTGSVAYVISGGTLVRDTLSLLLTVALMVLVMVTKRFDRAEFLLVSLLGAVQFAGIFIATFFSESLVTYGAGLMQASKSWFSVMLLVLVLVGCPGSANYTRRILLRFVVPVGLSVGISYLVVPVLVASFSIAYEGFWGTLSLAMGFFLGVLVFVFLSSIAVRSLPGEVSEPKTSNGAGSVAAVEAVARALGEERGCTAREQDVLALLVAGNTYKRVAELLNVTENTVQYHSKNIYRKFGVHTKQELVDLVAQER